MATETPAETVESGHSTLSRFRPAVEFVGACVIVGVVMVATATAVVVVNEIFAQHEVWAQTGVVFETVMGVVLFVPMGVTNALFARYLYRLIAGSAPRWESVALWGAAASLVLAVLAEVIF